MFCTNCGNELPDGTKFCTKCGKPVKQPPMPADAGKNDFPDLEAVASQKQQEAISNLPPQNRYAPPPDVYGTPPRITDEPSSPIREQISPPPQYDDLDLGQSEPKRKGNGAMIAVIVGTVLLIAVLIFVLMQFILTDDKPEDDQNSLSISSTSRIADEPDADDADDDDDAGDDMEKPADNAEPVIDWKDYTGVWQAGSYLFELTIEDGELNVTMADGSKSYWDSTDLDDKKDSVDFDLGGMAVRMKQRGKDSLRIAVNGERYQAERYSGSMPDYTPAPAPNTPASTPAPAPNAPAATAPAAVTGTDSGYLYYSSSTGTRTANSMVPSNSSLHFWPLDKYAISTADLDRLTREEIDIIRNEAYARYGYVFTTDKWNNFFSNYTWYVPDASFTDARFSKLEKSNIDTIVNYEKGKGWL